MPQTKDVPEWTYEHPADHPDNKPPVTAVAVPSDEEKEKYEASINEQIKKALPSDEGLQPLREPLVRVQIVDPDKEDAKSKEGDKSEKVDYEAKTVDELKDLARERGIDVAWDARKADLVKALEKHDKKG